MYQKPVNDIEALPIRARVNLTNLETLVDSKLPQKRIVPKKTKPTKEIQFPTKKIQQSKPNTKRRNSDTTEFIILRNNSQSMTALFNTGMGTSVPKL